MTTLLFFRRVTDVMTGHKAFSRRALADLTWDEDGFAAEIGITVGVLANKKLRLTEVPISYVYRLKGRSKIRFSDGLACLLRLVILRIRGRERKIGGETPRPERCAKEVGLGLKSRNTG
jgi:hypothetical protein